MTTCSKCKETKPFSQFSKNRGRPTGYCSCCKACDKARHKAANELLTPTEKEEMKEYLRAYAKANRGRIAKKARAWRKANKEKLNARKRFRRITDPEYREKDMARVRRYQEINKDELKAKAQKFRKANREKLSARSRNYYWDNKEERQRASKKYQKANKEKISAQRKAYRESPKGKQVHEAGRERNTEKRKKRLAWRWKNDPLWKLKQIISNTIRSGLKLKGYKKTSRTYEILGCSFKDFEAYIKKQFKEGMTWENHGEWELDHIVPKILAETKQEIEAINHYSNFQPLWKGENGSAGKWHKLDLDMVSPQNKIRYKTIISRHMEK